MKAGYLSRTITLTLLFLLLTVSAGMVYVTVENVVTLDSLSTQSLENTALALATAAENSLRLSDWHGKMAQIFSDRVVAYALITDDTGQIIFHTNPGLIGSSLSPSSFAAASRDGKTGRRISLGTGTPAYEFHHVIHGKGGTEEVLCWSSIRLRWTGLWRRQRGYGGVSLSPPMPCGSRASC
jgi:hypothetical protein